MAETAASPPSLSAASIASRERVTDIAPASAGARDTLASACGEKQLSLVSFGGVTLEFIQSPAPVPMTEGNIPHFALYVDDVDAAAAELKAAGADTFLTPEKEVLPDLFGGLQNWFFTGPSGEQIELLQML